MNRLQRILLAPFVAVIEIALLAVFLVVCARALFDWAVEGKS